MEKLEQNIISLKWLYNDWHSQEEEKQETSHG